MKAFAAALILAARLHGADAYVSLEPAEGASAAHLALTRTGSAFVWTSNRDGTFLMAGFDDVRQPIPLDKQITVATGTTGPSAIASDGENALVVWLDGQALRYALVSRAGVLTSRVITSATPLPAPVVTWSGVSYLVFWIDAQRRIVTTAITPQGMISSAHVVAQLQVPSQGIAAASGATSSAVVWNDQFDPACAGSCAEATWTASVDANGAVISLPERMPEAATPPVSVASNGDDFLVVWAAADFRIRGTLLREDTAIDTFTIVENAFHPQLVTSNSGYRLFWFNRVSDIHASMATAGVGADGRLRQDPSVDYFAWRFLPIVDVAGRPNGAYVETVQATDPRWLDIVVVGYTDGVRVRAARR